MYEQRTYRKQMAPEGMITFQAVEYESDLLVAVPDTADLEVLKKAVSREIHLIRRGLTDYEAGHPGFFESLVPLPVLKGDPEPVRAMKMAGLVAGVGPMAAVAGAVSQAIFEGALTTVDEWILENGGDLLMKTGTRRRIAVETGQSPFKDLNLLIEPSDAPIGICTSSGVLGHSLSFGRADAATVISNNVYLADAAATALGNHIKQAEDIEPALSWIQKIPGVLGALVIVDGRLGAWGAITLD